jgi:hypothetical protein
LIQIKPLGEERMQLRWINASRGISIISGSALPIRLPMVRFESDAHLVQWAGLLRPDLRRRGACVRTRGFADPALAHP